MGKWRVFFIGLGLLLAIVAREITFAETGQTKNHAGTLGPYCEGALRQGGLIICFATPGTRFETDDGRPVTIATSYGSAVLGLSRFASKALLIQAIEPNGKETRIHLTIARREDEKTDVNGVACDKLDARTEDQKAHAGRSWIKKQKAWTRFNAGRGALDGFRQPAEGRISSPFGFTRRYVTAGCETYERPHLGYDIAAPTGSPIIAPADGVVILAETDLYYEGGTIFLDHGHGLVSVFLHMSKLAVQEGDFVTVGEHLGNVGSTGRATGPHLHWAVKYRNPNASNREDDFYIDPELLLDLSYNK